MACGIVALLVVGLQVGCSLGGPHYGYARGGQASGNFENFYSSNTYLSSGQRAQFEEYWTCINRGQMERISASLQQTAQQGRYDEYFMALNYLVYLHDNHLKSSRLLELIEELIDQSIDQSIVHSSVWMTNSVTYNIVKYLLRRFRPNVIEPVEEVPYTQIDFLQPSSENINRLILALGSGRTHQRYYSLIVDYIRSMPNWVSQQLDFNQSTIVCLKQLLTLLLSTDSRSSTELREACQYYLDLFKITEMEYYAKQKTLHIMRQLVNVVPTYNTPYRQILLEFLASGDKVYELSKLAGHPMANQGYLIQLLQKGLSSSMLSTSVQQAFVFYVNYFQSMNVFEHLSEKLPHFTNSPGEAFYQILMRFFKGPEYKRFLDSMGFSVLDIKSTYLIQDTLSLLTTCTNVGSEVQSAANYYLEYYDMMAVKERYCLDQLFDLIPQPTLTSESIHYTLMQKLFSSTEFLQVVKQSNIQIVSDHRVMLHEVLNSVLRSSLFSTEYKETILHYYKFMYNEGLTMEQEQTIESLILELQSVQIESTVYEVVTSFLRSSMVYLVFQENRIDFTQSSYIVLEEICEVITHMHYLEVNVLEAAQYCKTAINQAFQMETRLITMVHQAFTSLQGLATTMVAKYQMQLDVFLQCDEMHTIIRHGHFDYTKDARELLYDILTVVEEDSNVQMEIREGAYHYSKYILEPLLGSVQCDMGQILMLLPQPTDTLSDRYFNLLQMYLQNGVPRYLMSQIDFHKTEVDLLQDILEALIYSNRIPLDIRATAKYYYQYFSTSVTKLDVNLLMQKLDKLTILLPRPRSIHDTQHYNLMVSYLKGKQILSFLTSTSVNLHKSDVMILRDILLTTLKTKAVYMDIKIVAKHYLTMIDNGTICDISSTMTYPVSSVSSIGILGTGSTASTTLHSTAATVATMNTQTQSSQATKIIKAVQSTSADMSNAVATSATKQATVAIPVSSVSTMKATAASSSSASVAVAKVASTQSTMSAASSTATSTTTSTHTSEQSSVLQKIKTELNQMELSGTSVQDREVIQNYLKTDMAYNLLETSGSNLQASGSNLLADFVEIAAHTNDIPTDLRVASERYEQNIPSLKISATATPHSYLEVLDNIFHKIVRTTVTSASAITCYNAFDRYLHTAVPSSILQANNQNLKEAPKELLQDLITFSREFSLTQDDTVSVQSLMQQTQQNSQLSHLYKLHKIFQLIEIPTDKTSLEYYYSLESYFRSDAIFQILQNTEVDFNLDSKDLLQSIFTLSISNQQQTISKNTVQAAVYFNNLIFTPSVEKELDIVFNLVQRPEEDQGLQAFETVNNYIHSPQAMVVANQVNFDVHRSPLSILSNVLDLSSHNSQVTSTVRQAAGYLLNQIPTATTTQSIQTISTQKETFSHSSVHSMKSLPSVSSSTNSIYGSLLNVLPESYRTTEDYVVLKQVFEQLTSSVVVTMLTQEVVTKLAENEEGLLRMLLLKYVHDSSQTVNVRTACAHIIRQRYFDFSTFASQVPTASYAEEGTYYNLVTQFLSGDEIYRYVDLSLTQYETSMESFKMVLEMLSICTEVSSEIRQASSYYLNHAFYDFASLVSFLPVPSRDNIKKLHTTMVSFLSSKELINRCTQQIDLSKFNGAQDLLLKEILQSAERCDWLDETIRVAAKYYLTVIKTVSISMRKVLTKELDLGDIFNDAFDFSAFTKNQFDAYHGLWNYVSSRTEELLSSPGFDFWMHNSKRGEFTTKFLLALNTKTDVPQEIIEDVEILKPLVLLTDGGALEV